MSTFLEITESPVHPRPMRSRGFRPRSGAYRARNRRRPKLATSLALAARGDGRGVNRRGAKPRWLSRRRESDRRNDPAG
jgi:hypothetical protein